MSDLTAEQQYQKEYDAALAELDAAAEGKPKATTAEVKTPDTVIDTEPAKQPEAATPDPLAEMQARLEKAEKALKDTQAWGTKNAQRLADMERERVQQQREATKPAILDANPDLAEAIRYVANDPIPQQQAQKQQQTWQEMVQTAHPGIFDVSIDPELEAALLAKRESLGDAWHDPLIAIREIAAEKVALTERQVGKRFAIESAKQAQKSAMSVPGAKGGTARTIPDPDKEAADRILKMSDAEFAKEVRRVKGY